MEPLAIALLLAIANQKIIDYLFAPVRQKFPDLDMWWVLYVALASGFALGWFSEVNLFAQYIPAVTAGRVISAVLVGGGASLIHDIFDGGK